MALDFGEFDFSASMQPYGGQSGPSAEFDFGNFDFQNFDYGGFLKQMHSDFFGNLPQRLDFDAAGTQGTSPTLRGEDLGYHFDKAKGVWEQESPGGTRFSLSPQEMEERLHRKNMQLGRPGSSMEEVRKLYEADVQNLYNAELQNYKAELGFNLGQIGAAFAGAEDILKVGRDTNEFLKAEALKYGEEGEALVAETQAWIDEQMAQAKQYFDQGIQTAQKGHQQWLSDLGQYQSESAQVMAATAQGLWESAAPMLSQIQTGMHPDGTPMTKAEIEMKTAALQYSTGKQVGVATGQMANHINEQVLQGKQYASQLMQGIAGLKQQAGAQLGALGAEFGRVLLGAREQQRGYDQLATSLNLQAENALASSQMQATQLRVSSLQAAAELYRDFNPVSFLSGFLNIMAVPPEVWMRPAPFTSEIAMT